MHKALYTIFSAFLILYTTISTSAAQLPPEITWELTNRFRLIADDSSAEEELYKLAAASEQIEGGLTDTLKIDHFPVSSGFYSFSTMPNTHYHSYSAATATRDKLAGTYDPSYVKAPTSWPVVIRAKNIPVESDCIWKLDGRKIQGKGNCQEFLPDSPVQLAGNSGKFSLEINQIDVAEVIFDPSDMLVVGLGDSYASGEGSPDVGKVISKGKQIAWLDQKCHRSLLSWQPLAAAKLAHDNPHRSITFISRACSGAITDEVYFPCDENQKHEKNKDGVRNKDYCSRGIEKKLRVGTNDTAILTSQIQQIIGDLCPEGDLQHDQCTTNVRQPDLVLLSIGGNDAGFGKLIIDAITSNIAYCENGRKADGDCQSGAQPKYKQKIKNGVDNLWMSYFEMATAISSSFPKAKVIHAIYTDPLMRNGNEGHFCGIYRDEKISNDRLLTLAGRAGIIGFILDVFGKRERQDELLSIRDDFVTALTGSVADYPAPNEHLGLRAMGVATQCSFSHGPIDIYSRIPTTEELQAWALSSACKDFWGKTGFSKYLEKAKWNYVLLRNEYKDSNRQLKGFVTNGYCLPADNVSGRWFRVLKDSQKNQGDATGTLHPNIFGYLFYVRRVMPAIYSALGEK